MTAPLSDSLQPFRVAIAFGVIPARCGPEPFGINELKQIKTEAAKCAMAACGVIDWKTASRRARSPPPPDKVHTAEIFDHLNIPDRDQTKGYSQRLRTVMEALGWTHSHSVRIDGLVRAGYVRKK